MSRAAQELAAKFRALTKPPDVTLDGEVTAVQESDFTCTVKLANGLPLEGVHLKALKGATKGFIILPKVGSQVQIVNLGEPDYLVVAFEEIDKAIIKTGTSELTMDAGGYEVKRGSETLAKILDDLFTAIAQLTVTTGVGPSGVPINLATFQQIQQRTKSLLK